WVYRLSSKYSFYDPKYAVTLLVLILYAVYFRLARTTAWRGARASKLCVFNFLIVFLSFTVVNLYLSANHRFFLKERPRSGMEIVLVGLNHRTAPVEVRERVSFTADQARRASEELRSKGILEETLVLSTCNRSEVYGVPPETSRECAPGLSTFLSEFHSV